MFSIEPLDKKTISNHIGNPLLILTKDGNEHFGILSHLDSNKLYFNDFNHTTSNTSKLKKKNIKTKKSNKKKKATTFQEGIGFFPNEVGFTSDLDFGSKYEIKVSDINLLFDTSFF
ncbi:hypothetical protein [Chengkuizengella axinellae]|uniref:CBS domain-containing protein n=1 Tax=Chengkuizengella axinellae TaxID=3064388 RepID=A0ABT9IT38_9BACL|nr:hypothetical protein [Chengkuizengella sp. 2205SS18-9]MDP5272516.1 hypothetical protein [Chengkuizengella sp. 2205SS18-9]